MVKVRMNTADVAAEVKCLKRLIGMRCSNVYDLSPKAYMFKLVNSSGVTDSGESEKVLLLMESGVRLHTTAYVRDKSNTPSGFTLKLRKHIRTRRLEDVRQLGYDRIVLFQFGLGANAHYVILELYAQGNILLTDSEFIVMTLLRSHRDDDKGLAIMSRHRYPAEMCRVFERTTTDKLSAALHPFRKTDETETANSDDCENGAIYSKNTNGRFKGESASLLSKNAVDTTRSKPPTLKSVLGETLGYGPQLSEHIILDAGLMPNVKVSKDSVLSGEEMQLLVQAVSKFEDWLEGIMSGELIPAGYILGQKNNLSKTCNPSESVDSMQLYDEFCPILLNQFKSREHLKFETFDASMDEFYSKIESQKSEQQQKAKEDSAVQKLNKIRLDQENRAETLKKEVERCIKKAELIEYNLDDVDAAILAVRVSLAKGMNWEDIARMVKEEKKSGNPVAGLIDKLHLERNSMTLLLCNNLDEMDDDEITLPVEKVEVDLALSAHANARRWYEMKKKQESKQEKTITAHEKAFKAAERKTRQQLAQEKTVATITHMRKVHWFEKFNWFISSENYLIISGRDAQQNEMIVKRYMSKGDLYVHADLHGASTTVIKNHKPEQPVPPLTLNQAGCFTVCRSQAWDSKIVTSAWWVYPDQVSKSAPTGEYLTVGSFMIRGKKNFLPPHPLIMGFGLLFRLDESSLGSHLNERRVRGEEEGRNDAEDTVISHQNSEYESEYEAADVGSLIRESEAPEVHEEEEKASSSLNRDSSDAAPQNIISLNPKLEDLLDKALGLGSPILAVQNNMTEKLNFDLPKDIQEKTIGGKDKPYVSKAERRKLKKGQIDADASSAHGKQKPKDNGASAEQPEKNPPSNRPVGRKVTRGQRGKLKKIKEKYADQDEEERKLRMALLGSVGKAQKQDENTQNEETDASKEKKFPGDSEDAIKVCFKCKKAGHLARDCQEHRESILRSHAKGRAVDNTRADPDDSAEMDKVALEEDDINEIGEDERGRLNDIDYLTGNPFSSDVLLYAVPVCGPYNAVQSYKYRVKLIPGTAKKGKAAKTAMNLFSHMPEATSREKELIKACTDPELVAAMVGNVKLTAAGLSQLKQKQKKGKKSIKN